MTRRCTPAERAGQPHLCQVRPHPLPGAIRQPGGQGPDDRGLRAERALRYAGPAAHDHPHLPLDERRGAGRAASSRPSDPARKFPRNPAKYVMVPGNAMQAPPGDRAAHARAWPNWPRPSPTTASSRATARWGSSPAAWPTSTPGGLPGGRVLHLGMTWPLPEQLIRAVRRLGRAPDRDRRAGPVHRRGASA